MSGDLSSLPPDGRPITTTEYVGHYKSRRRIRTTFIVYDGEDSRTVTLIGRDAWALGALIHAGPAGCTPITTPGPRWSHYVWKLRHKYHLNIETIDEEHGGPYAGVHARYVLRQRVEIASDESEAA